MERRFDKETVSAMVTVKANQSTVLIRTGQMWLVLIFLNSAPIHAGSPNREMAS